MAYKKRVKKKREKRLSEHELKVDAEKANHAGDVLGSKRALPPFLSGDDDDDSIIHT